MIRPVLELAYNLITREYTSYFLSIKISVISYRQSSRCVHWADYQSKAGGKFLVKRLEVEQNYSRDNESVGCVNSAI